MTTHRFSDFAKESKKLIGDKMKIDDLLGKEVKITGYDISDSKYNKHENRKVLTLQFELSDESHIVFTGSSVLIDQTETYKDEIPFLTKIEKVNKYYTFT